MSRTVDEEELFAKEPIGRAVFSMILPTIISQIIIVIYNLADTLYVGLTENANAVAAISLCLPVYSLLSALSNLFGIGGAAAAARALGKKERTEGRQGIKAFPYWSICNCGLLCDFHGSLQKTAAAFDWRRCGHNRLR